MAFLKNNLFWARMPLGWMLAALCLLGPALPRSYGQVRPEMELKAIFFVTLARYTIWPTNVFDTPTQPLVIGVIGSNPFGSKLNSLVKDEHVQGHPLELQTFHTVEEIKVCHMLYFGEMSPSLRTLRLSQLGKRPILTVSDERGFIDDGGMVELFVNKDDRVRLKVARGRVEGAALNFSPALWKLAELAAVFENFPVTIFWSDAWQRRNVLALSEETVARYSREIWP